MSKCGQCKKYGALYAPREVAEGIFIYGFCFKDFQEKMGWRSFLTGGSGRTGTYHSVLRTGGSISCIRYTETGASRGLMQGEVAKWDLTPKQKAKVGIWTKKNTLLN